MKIYEKGIIQASPEKIWPYLADPILMSGWNEKLVAINRRAEGSVSLGEQYDIRYRMSNKESETHVTVISLMEPNRIEFQHTSHLGGKKCEVTESYELTLIAQGTRFLQTIDTGKMIPWWARPIIGFISRFGHSVGKTNAEKIYELIESEG